MSLSKKLQGHAFVALCLIFGLGGCADEKASISTPGSVTELMISAPSLSGNLLGDPAEQRLSIYLPPGYETSGDRRYPVLYLLHGFTGTNRTWLIDPERESIGPEADPRDGGYQRAGFLNYERLDQLISDGKAPELIIVAPNGRNAYKHSFYINSPISGHWEDYIVEDVVGFVDENYRTLKTAGSRGVAGHSGGANGALLLAMRHPEVFGSVYAMAPCCSGELFSLPQLQDPETGQPTPFWRNVYSRIHALSTIDEAPNPFTSQMEDFYVNVELAASVAYAPNPDRAPLYGDYLFEMDEGSLVLNESALERRLAQSVYRQIDEYEAGLRSLRGIFIDYGEHEMQDLVSGNAEFAKALAQRGIPFVFEVYADGDHGNMVAERLESRGLAFFAETLELSSE